MHAKPLEKFVEATITSARRGTSMSNVFVLDTNKQPLDPVHPGRARMLLACGKAAVYKRYPFTIILKAAVEYPAVHLLRIKIDPGSQTTGIALVDDGAGAVVWAAELTHRGPAIKRALDQRRPSVAGAGNAERATARLVSSIADAEPGGSPLRWRAGWRTC